MNFQFQVESLSESIEREPHNYMLKLRWLAKHKEYLPAGKVTEVEIVHDDWCGIHAGGYCNCNPEVKVDGAQVGAPDINEILRESFE